MWLPRSHARRRCRLPHDTSDHIECFRAEGGVIVTPDMLDAWADAAELGDYPGFGGDATVYFGRIPPTDDELKAERVHH